MSRRTLLLADGTSYQGEAFGADREVSAEVVFTTGMTGYQETLTDQSYNGQIVTFTSVSYTHLTLPTKRIV